MISKRTSRKPVKGSSRCCILLHGLKIELLVGLTFRAQSVHSLLGILSGLNGEKEDEE